MLQTVLGCAINGSPDVEKVKQSTWSRTLKLNLIHVVMFSESLATSK